MSLLGEEAAVRHCFLVLLRARVPLLRRRDAVPGKDLCAPPAASGFLKHDLVSSLGSLTEQVFSPTVTYQESEASGSFRVHCPGRAASECQSWYGFPGLSDRARKRRNGVPVPGDGRVPFGAGLWFFRESTVFC